MPVLQAVVCVIVCGIMHIKEPMQSERVGHVVAAGFLSRYLNGPLPKIVSSVVK